MSWAVSRSNRGNVSEYDLIQTKPKSAIVDELSSRSTEVIIEETTLLILNDLDILESVLGEIKRFALIRSVFERINNLSHPYSGSVSYFIPQEIAKAIEANKEKLSLIEDNGNLIETYQAALTDEGCCLISDDNNMLGYLAYGDSYLGNTVDLIEALFIWSIISEDRKYELISKLCSLKNLLINFDGDALAEYLCYFTSSKNRCDYSDTPFKSVFDNAFSDKRDTADAIRLFFSMLHSAGEKYDYDSNPKALVSLFRGFLIRHPYSTPLLFACKWFLYQCKYTVVKIEYSTLAYSEKHKGYWNTLINISKILTKEDIKTEHLCSTVVDCLFLLNENDREEIFEKI